MIEVGKTYLDIWGYEHLIRGFVRIGDKRDNKFDETRVWSAQDHFCVETGEGMGDNLYDDLDNTIPAQTHIEFWENRIKQIESVNSEDKLKLIADRLQNMRDRIESLKVNYEESKTNTNETV